MAQFTQKTRCSICDTALGDPVISLPGLPSKTGIFVKEKAAEKDAGIDQFFHICAACGHGQVSVLLDSEILYGKTYSFRTSLSQTATKGAAAFISFLNKVSKEKVFDTIVDVGCNDLYLLRQLKKKGRNFYGIDPLFREENVSPDKQTTLIGKMAEDVTIEDFKGKKPDLIISTHTLEHVQDPRGMIEKLMSFTSEEALFVFEFPCLEIMVELLRFDRIFDQHLQYFTLASFKNLLSRVDAEYIAHDVNYEHWGSLRVAFQKKRKKKQRVRLPENNLSSQEIKKRYRCFQEEMQKTAGTLQALGPGNLVGYGASLMVPILFYHLGIDESLIGVILDDDSTKEDLYYAGLNVLIKKAGSKKELKDKNVVVTALDHVQVIVRKVQPFCPRQMIVPLNVFAKERVL